MKRTATLVLTLFGAATIEARITRITIDQRISPAFNGASYGTAGQYETITGRAYGVLDPRDPANAIIQDLELAPPKTGLSNTWLLSSS